MGVGKVRSLPQSQVSEKCSTQVGSDLTHKQQSKLGGLPGTSTLAYYEYTEITAVKSFITLHLGGLNGSRGRFHNTFYFCNGVVS